MTDDLEQKRIDEGWILEETGGFRFFTLCDMYYGDG